jgi:hypothetical protein
MSKLPKLADIVVGFMKLRNETHRYASFDYCYNHFHPSNPKRKSDSEKSCFVLWGYLSSWGMLRGSSFLLKERCVKSFEPIVQFIYGCDKNDWSIDVDKYNDENVRRILDITQTLKKQLQGIFKDEKSTTVTLITKIMLGVFGFVPAFDSRFKKTFSGFTSVSEKSLLRLRDIYQENQDVLDLTQGKYQTLVFNKGEQSHPYTKAKIIDMYGFERNEPLK